MAALIEALGQFRGKQRELVKQEKVARLLTSAQREVVGSIVQILPDINAKTRVIFDGAQTMLVGQVVNVYVDGQVAGEKVDLLLVPIGDPHEEPSGLKDFVGNEILLMSEGQIRTTRDNPSYRILEPLNDSSTKVIIDSETSDNRARIRRALDPSDASYVNLGTD